MKASNQAQPANTCACPHCARFKAALEYIAHDVFCFTLEKATDAARNALMPNDEVRPAIFDPEHYPEDAAAQRKAQGPLAATQSAVVSSEIVSCDHYWCYEHAVWQARQDDQSKVAVGRYCSKCGKMETAITKDWHPLPASYVDMREKLELARRS